MDPDNPYSPPGSDDPLPATEYTEFTNRNALRSGFTPLGSFYHAKTKLYRVRYNAWLSPDRVVLAWVGGGTVASILLNATWLFTRLRDGRCLLTIDDPKAGDSDLSGLTDQAVVRNADFEELLAKHRQRVESATEPAEPYSNNDPIGDHRAFLAFRTERLEERGLVRFLDAERTSWKYGVVGAIMVAVRTTLRQYRQSFENRGREAIRRPGDPGYVLSDRRPALGRRAAQLGKVELFFLVMVGVGAMMAFTGGPARTRAQGLFRVAVSGIGLAGLLITHIVKFAMKRAAVSSAAPAAAWPRAGEEVEKQTWEEDD